MVAFSKKSSCKIIERWIKSIGNHFCWVCATCEGDPELLREKWISVLFRIQNKHERTGSNRFTKCVHPPLTKKQVKAKKWISPNSVAFEALQKIILSKNILTDLTYLTRFCHTGVLEAYHSLYNKWTPKRQHFSYAGMITQSQLSMIDFNERSKLEQATTRQCDKRYNVIFSKISKNWSSKPIREKKGKTYLHKMVKGTIESAANGQSLENPILASFPRNIA